ncbi:unnamed protein product [Ostreobium quekettii]|uniref:Urease accessory protein UreH-like transmembrane domain-containing protein n=1 Tax=Ostreobium quekettii TaxID=121088 RepID=A0A8S1JBU0_9CHLO|nr:unnamed protein product [Ostreobium quekettii]
MGGPTRLPLRMKAPLVGRCTPFWCAKPPFRNLVDRCWRTRYGPEERRLRCRVARCLASSSEVGIEVGRSEGRQAVERNGQPVWENEWAFRCARIAGSMFLSCCLLAALHCTAVPSGRFASLAAHGTARMTSAGVREAVRGGWAGLWAGTLHTLCGPDHLAGLTPLTLGKSQSIAAALGALWGFGHSTGQLLLGLAFIFLKERFQGIVPVLSKWSGAIVGCTLIAIGLVGLYESMQVEEHVDVPGGSALVAGLDGQGSTDGAMAKRRGLGTYMMGFVYGLHPDALFVVLPALALPTRLGAFMYIGMFVFGTVMAMGGYSLAIGTASEAAAKERPLLLRHLSTIAAGLAILVGIVALLTGFGFELPG